MRAINSNTLRSLALKRILDLLIVSIIVALLGWLIALVWIINAIYWRDSGIFSQKRLGRECVIFNIYKFKTMRPASTQENYISTSSSKRITTIGRVLRKFKLDEFPQLLNVLYGDMSIVGPRPDMPGFLDNLSGPEKAIQLLKPGITGPASIYFSNEEELLDKVVDPVVYNQMVIWPKKIRLNYLYFNHRDLCLDFSIVLFTIIPASWRSKILKRLIMLPPRQVPYRELILELVKPLETPYD